MHVGEHAGGVRVARGERRSTLAATAAAFVLAFARGAAAMSFLPDSAFGTGGTVVLDHAGVGHDVVAQASGRIVVLAADDTQLFALGLAPDGSPDPSFGAGGMTPLPETAGWTSRTSARLVVDDDDRIVVSGETAGQTLFVARLLPDGALDASFGDDGVAVPPQQPSCATDWCRRGPTAIALDAQGRIVVATTYDDDASDGTGIAALRFAADGVLDATFGSGGVARAEPARYDRPGGIAIGADGRIVAVATRVSPDGYDVGEVLVAFTAQGTLDARFAHDGSVLLELPGGGSAADVVLDDHSRLVVVGSGHPGATAPLDMMVQRWLPSGVLDRSFGTRGLAFAGADDFGRPSEAFGTEVAIAADGTIVAWGHAAPTEPISPCAYFTTTALATFSPAGTPGAGNTTRALGNGFSGTTLLPDGAFLGVGTRFPPCHVVDQPPRLLLSRFVPIEGPTTPPGAARIRPPGTAHLPGGTVR